jgi:hypothetical protein
MKIAVGFPRHSRHLFPTLFLCAQVAFPVWAADPLHSAIDTRVAGQKEAVQSQQQVDALADQTQSMLQEYRQLNDQLGDLKTYDDQLERLVASQKKDIESHNRQLANLGETQIEIIPLMLRMLKALEDTVALDAPFLTQERQTRLKNLRAMMDSPDAPLPEKYRRIMEAYQIETDYGRNIEAYSGDLEKEGRKRTVDFLRAGRVALVYATLDGDETGYWDGKDRAWKTLPREYNEPVLHALRVARKQAPPDMVRLPVPAPEAAQ